MNMKKLRHLSSGFTMIELIVAISISTVIILMTTQVFIEGIKSNRAASSESRLVSAGSYIAEVLVNHIRQSDRLSLTNPAELVITSPVGVPMIVRLNNSRIEIDGQPIHSSLIIADSLAFVLLDNSVEVQYQLNTRFADRPLVARTVITSRK
jgi:prepilin-type N-terminal cleavage/methylation domain-containing protein